MGRMGRNVTRLYEQFQPAHYELQLQPNRDTLTFSGTVTIRGKKTGRPSRRLTFHQQGLKISAGTITKHDKKGKAAVAVSRINNQNGADEVRLHTGDMIYPGEYTVTMEFSGKITKTMHGIYPCNFKHDGQDKIILVTQFESHHAREAFPCIDEPEAKATFDLTLLTPAGETVLANTPVKNQKQYASQGGGQTAAPAKAGTTTPEFLATTFETTPRMSTYLLAFTTGEMHGVEGKTKDGVLVRSWASVAQPKDHLQYANDEAVKILEFFIDYFQTPFPLKKLDQVAVPDFEVLAMENWGLITFREVGLLADPKNRSLSGEQLVTLVIAHEISHQWFGNLVTMKWWEDLWLNESFASIMENLAPDALHPDWHQWEDFATSRVLSASNRDIYKDVQSVGVEVRHPDEIMTLFDPAIVYAKGARLLTMLRDYVGEEAFRDGLKSYFKKHAYKNTARGDLWAELSKASGRDIGSLMTPWIEQSGQPLIRVKQAGGGLQLSQKRFLLDGQDDRLWPIPLLAKPAVQPDLMTKRELRLESGSQKNSSKAVPVFNAEGSGHYIVSYEDEAARASLQQQVADRSLDAVGRINVLNDMLLLARAYEYSLTDILDLVQKCADEPRAAVWSMLMRAIGQAQTLTDGDEATEKHIRTYKRRLAENWYKKLGWDDKPDDDPNTKHLRTTALALSVSGEDPDALKHALAAYKKAGGVEKLPAEQRAMIAGAAVRFGPAETIKQLMDEYEASPSPDVQQAITLALCSTRDPAVAKRILKWGLTPEKGAVRPQDVGHWFAYLMGNHYSRELTWQWLESNWGKLIKLFGGGKSMEYFIWYSSRPFSTPDWQKRFETFFTPKMDEPALKRNIQIAFSEIAARVEWRRRDEAKLKAYFKKSGA